MSNFEMPATLPGSMKEQLQALAPYMISYQLKANGGWVADLQIPIDAFITADFNHEILAVHDMKLSVTIEPPEMPLEEVCGLIRRKARYADVELSYK